MNKLLKLMSLYPPFLGAGIQVKIVGKKEDEFLVTMPLRFYNKNYVGTHFGGNLYSMCDPFYMLILMHKLGKDYLVWDKSAQIEFKSPGRSKVKAHFKIDAEQVEKIKEEIKSNTKSEPEFTVEVKDDENKLVALVHKKLWIKKKDNART